ncbi:MAG: beta-lactamase family protein [Cytophagales bacterium]|nr:beta-lactamase family protein [Cytophagales bacterium]
MKSVRLIAILCLLAALAACQHEAFQQPVGTPVAQPYKTDHSKGAALQAIIDQYTRKGVPGIVVAIKDREGAWEGASGFAKLETGERLTPGFVHAGASLTKIYTAAAVLKLKEAGRVELDQPITRYLPPSVTGRISQAEAITVRMLLNHTSGIPDFIENSIHFKLKWFNDLSRGWTTEEALSYAYDKPLRFKPGSSFSYANVNYVLLSLLINHVTGKPEGAFIAESLLEPLGLRRTYYKVQPAYPDGLPMPNYYLDRYGDGRLQNVTVPARAEIRSELGDGGLVATALDFVTFMEALAGGRVVSAASLDEMKTFGLGEYGLGLETGFNYGKQTQYGHLGAIFGGASLLLYFEAQQTGLFIAANVDASLVGGKTLFLYHEMKNKLGEYLSGDGQQ